MQILTLYFIKTKIFIMLFQIFSQKTLVKHTFAFFKFFLILVNCEVLHVVDSKR